MTIKNDEDFPIIEDETLTKRATEYCKKEKVIDEIRFSFILPDSQYNRPFCYTYKPVVHKNINI